MKMVSAAKLRKAQDKIVRLRPYANKLHELLVDSVTSLSDSELRTFMEGCPLPKKSLLLSSTSNRGLCGAFNTNVINEKTGYFRKNTLNQLRKGTLQLLTIGRKGFDYFRKQKNTHASGQNNLFNNLTFEKCYIGY